MPDTGSQIRKLTSPTGSVRHPVVGPAEHMWDSNQKPRGPLAADLLIAGKGSAVFCVGELSVCELEAALPTSPPATARRCAARRRSHHQLTPDRLRGIGSPGETWLKSKALLSSWQQSPAGLSDIPPTFIYTWTFLAVSPVFMLMFAFGDVGLS